MSIDWLESQWFLKQSHKLLKNKQSIKQTKYMYYVASVPYFSSVYLIFDKIQSSTALILKSITFEGIIFSKIISILICFYL